MTSIVPMLEGWEARVGQLADRLVNFETDKLIQRDIKEVPSNIERMQALWEAETDPATRKQIERTLAGYKEQQAQLEALALLMRRTRFVLDDTLASMGTIYSQVQVLDAMDIDSARAARIGEEIQEQVDKLNDVLSAFSDVNQLPVDEVGDEARRIRLEKGSAAGTSRVRMALCPTKCCAPSSPSSWTRPLRSAIARVQGKFKRLAPPGSVKWVAPEGIHLTLKFLGDTPASRLGEIEAALRVGLRRLCAVRIQRGGARLLSRTRAARASCGWRCATRDRRWRGSRRAWRSTLRRSAGPRRNAAFRPT